MQAFTKNAAEVYIHTRIIIMQEFTLYTMLRRGVSYVSIVQPKTKSCS